MTATGGANRWSMMNDGHRSLVTDSATGRPRLHFLVNGRNLCSSAHLRPLSCLFNSAQFPPITPDDPSIGRPPTAHRPFRRSPRLVLACTAAGGSLEPRRLHD